MEGITLTGWLTILNLLLVIGVTLGGVMAFRSAKSNAEHVVDARVRDMLDEENKILLIKVDRLEKEMKRMQAIIRTVQAALKRRGLSLEINDEVITLVDDRARQASTVQIRIDTGDLPQLEEKKEK